MLEDTPSKTELQIASLRVEIANMFAEKGTPKKTLDDMLGYKPHGYKTR